MTNPKEPTHPCKHETTHIDFKINYEDGSRAGTEKCDCGMIRTVLTDASGKITSSLNWTHSR